MKRGIMAGWIAGVVSALSAADDGADRVLLAAMRLGEAGNYSWSSSVMDDARSYTVEGKTQPGGFTWMRLPMVPVVAQRLGREADIEFEAVFLGGARAVIRTAQGWRCLSELPKRSRDWQDTYMIMPPLPLWDGASGGDAQEIWGLPPTALAALPVEPDEEQRPYSNAQFALALPHEELAIIVSCYAEIAVKGATAVGRLSDLGARLLLVREGQDQLDPICAAGSFRLQLKGGMVTEYFLRLEGVLQVARKRVHVRQASRTTVRDIGATRLVVPEEARRKLAGG